MFAYIYIYILIFISYLYPCICMHTHMHTHTYIHQYICIYTHIHRHSHMYRYKSRKLAPWSLRELLFTNSFLGRNWPSEALLPDISRTFRATERGRGALPTPLPPALLLDISDAGCLDKGGGGPPPPPLKPPPPPEGPLRGQLLSLLLLCTLQHAW